MTSFKIVFDNIIFNLQRAGGVSVYWSELFSRIIKLHQDFHYYGFGSDNVFFKTLNITGNSKKYLPISISRYLPQFLSYKSSPLVFHSSYYRISISRNVANITTVHDFTYEHYYSGISKFVHCFQKHLAIKLSDGIICVSENTKRDLLHFIPGVDSTKIKTIYNGVGDEFFPLSIYDPLMVEKWDNVIERSYILFVGDRSSYKNFELAVQVAKEVGDHALVIVGGKSLAQSDINYLTEALGDNFFHCSGISSNELNYLYNKAVCLLYPSKYEGFGIPVLEAMKAGCPVVSTNLSSIPEVAGDAALLASTVEVSEFVELISQLKDGAKRADLIRRGFIQASKFSWDKCFEETYAFYKEVYERKFL